MAGPGDSEDRERLYRGRGRNGVVLGREFAFYPGAPTVPANVTGNLALGAHSGGAGDYLLDGVGPPLDEVVPCQAVTVASITCEIDTNGGDVLVVTVLYDVLPGDIYVIFNTSTGQQFTPESVTPIVDGVEVRFDADSPPLDPGSWSFKIMRSANPDVCFFVKAGCLVIVGAPACTITVTDMSGDGVSPNPPLTPGDNDNTVSVVGTGFLSGPLTVTITPAFGGPTPLSIDFVTVIDDNNLDIQFDTNPVETGNYGVRVELTADPTCFGQIGFGIFEPQIVVAFF